MKRIILFILSLLFITTTLSADIWRDCDSPECHYEETNVKRKVNAELAGKEYEPIVHNCEKCISHKCIECYYLFDENGDVVFITRDKFTNEITVYFKATGTFLHDVVVNVLSLGPHIDSNGEIQSYCFWVLKCDERLIYIDFINEEFDIRDGR